ncbi:MAG: hypothetical protein ACEPOZ_13055 [Marinifilaceae bacterium]
MNIILLVLFCLLVTESLAQRGFVSFGWQGGEATENTKDFISERSYEGFNFKVERFVLWGFALGLEVNYTHFYEEAGLQFHQLGNTTYTGQTFKYFDAAPVLFTGRIYLGARRDGFFVPYFGAGAGAYYVQETMEVGSVVFQNDGWAWGVAPQAGLMLRLDEFLYLFGEAAYNKIFERGDIGDHTFFTGTVGLRFGF